MTTYVYFIMGDSPNPSKYAVKIGVSANPEERLRDLQTANPGNLWLQATIKLDSRQDAIRLERQLHKQFSASRISGEWFYQNRFMSSYLGVPGGALN